MYRYHGKEHRLYVKGPELDRFERSKHEPQPANDPSYHPKSTPIPSNTIYSILASFLLSSFDTEENLLFRGSSGEICFQIHDEIGLMERETAIQEFLGVTISRQ